MPVDKRPGVIILRYKGKGKRTECKDYKGISLLSVVEKNIIGNVSGQSK